MKIKLNGNDINTQCITLEELVKFESHKTNSIATAVNGEFVAIESRSNTLLSEDDEVEFIAPMSGG